MSFFLFRFRAARLVLTLLFCLLVETVHAQPGIRGAILPVGIIEPLMGNTGTGGLGTSAASFYNPAALTLVKGNSISLSGSGYTVYRFLADPIFKVGDQSYVYEGEGFQSTPTTFIAVKTFDKWKLSYSVLVPATFKFEGSTTWNIRQGQSVSTFRALQNYQEEMILLGASAAKKLNEYWSLGISVYGQVFGFLSYTNTRTTIESDNAFLVENISRIKYNPNHILVTTGVCRSKDRLNLGLKISFPNIYAFGKGGYFQTVYSKTVDSIPAQSAEMNIEGVKAAVRLPWEFRAGAVYDLDKWRLASDFSYGLGIKYDIFPTPNFDNVQDYQAGVRFSAGAEYEIKSSFHAYAGGVLFSLPTKNELETVSRKYYATTTGVKINVKFIESTIGVLYTHVKSRSKPNVASEFADEIFEYFCLFLGTSYSF